MNRADRNGTASPGAGAESRQPPPTAKPWSDRGLSLAVKISLCLLLVFSVSVAGLAWIGQQIVLGAFVDTEVELALRNRNVVSRTLDSELVNLRSTNTDWGLWDDLYYFTLGTNPGFATEQLEGRENERLRLDVTLFLDPGGRTLYVDLAPDLKAASRSPLDEIAAPVMQALAARAAINGGAGAAASQSSGALADDAVSGLLDTSAGPMMVAARTIHRTDGSGTSAGVLVMARRVHPEQLSAALSVMPSQVLVHGSSQDSLPSPELHELAGKLATGTEPGLLITRDNELSDFQLFRDLNGKPAFLLETRVPRTIVANGREATRLLLLAVMVSACFGLMVLLILVRRVVSDPLARLANHMRSLRQAGGGAPTPEQGRRDEIGALARRFDELLFARQEDQARLERLAAAVEHAGDAVTILSAEGRIEYVNPQYERQTGRTRAQVIGQVPGRSSQAGEGQYAELWATVRAGSTWTGMLQTVRPDGTPGFEDVTIAPIKDAEGRVTSFVAVMRDVTVRRQTEAELRTLSAVVEFAAQSIAVLDADGRIRYINPAYERIHGVRAADVVGGLPGKVVSGMDDQSVYLDMWKTTASGATWKGRIRSRLDGGQILTEDAVISPIMAEGAAPTSYVVILNDVTERIALEEQLAEARKLEAVGQLAAGVAHEINTPTQYVGGNIRFLRDAFTSLTTLLTELRALAGQPGDASALSARLTAALNAADADYLVAEVPAAINQSLEGVERVGEIVRSMKELSHPARQLAPTDLNRIIGSAVRVAAGEWQGVAEVRTELDPDLPLVPCLAVGINQVIINMLVNAAHAIEEAAPLRGGRPGQILLATRCVGNSVELSVSDDGAGMPEDVRQRVFDPFFTTKAVGRGTGQGLAIAHNVIKKHGGTIAVDSMPGRGTRFTISLPLGVPADAAATGLGSAAA